MVALQEEAWRLRDKLKAERSKGFWRKQFGVVRVPFTDNKGVLDGEVPPWGYAGHKACH